MKKTFLKQAILLLIILFSMNISYSQEKEKIPAKNVTAKQEEDKVIIKYDLEGSKDTTYTISVYLLKTSDESFKAKLKNVEGDIEGKLSGTSRKIIWSYSKDMDDKIVPGDILDQDIKFYVEAEYFKSPITDLISMVEPEVKPPDGGIPKIWYYIGGAVLVGGGVTAYLLLNKKEENNFPKPPGKPQ